MMKEISTRAFGDWPLRTDAEEFLCEGTTDWDCAEVTTGLYLTPEEVRDPDTLKRHLMIAFGLDFPEELLGVPHPLKSADEEEPR